MQKIYANLSVGNHVDGHMELFVQSTFGVVLDVTSELSTRKWNRTGVTLRKIGFAKSTAMNPSKIKKALDFIQEHRSQNHNVLVCCDDGVSRSKVIGIAYLVANKGIAIEEAIDMAGGIEAVPQETLNSLMKFCKKFAVNEVLVP